MTQPSDKSNNSHQWVKDIKQDDHVKDLYLVKAKKSGLTKKGDPFLSITLTDRSGDIEARVWDRAEALSGRFKEGDIVKVEGRAVSYRNQIQMTLSDIEAPEVEADPSIFLEATSRDVDQMMADIRKLFKKMDNHHLKLLVDLFLSDHKFISLFKKAPAAKNFHHGYIGGLLEHTLSVCRMAKYVAEHYPELDGNLLLAGAFLHDIGKVKELTFGRFIDYSDEGRLLGHIILGVGMLDEKLSKVKQFPNDLAVRLKHLILSHHGEYDFGSPKRPKFLEAFALNLIDDLDAKINGLSRFMERDKQEGGWTDFNRLFERYLLKENIIKEEEPVSSHKKYSKQQVLFSK